MEISGTATQYLRESKFRQFRSSKMAILANSEALILYFLTISDYNKMHKFAKNETLEPLNLSKTHVLEILNTLEIILDEILVAEKFLNFYTVLKFCSQLTSRNQDKDN